jgi:hypothetical protein
MLIQNNAYTPVKNVWRIYEYDFTVLYVNVLCSGYAWNLQDGAFPYQGVTGRKTEAMESWFVLN